MCHRSDGSLFLLSLISRTFGSLREMASSRRNLGLERPAHVPTNEACEWLYVTVETR
jgi:hypothetical protein